MRKSATAPAWQWKPVTCAMNMDSTRIRGVLPLSTSECGWRLQLLFSLLLVEQREWGWGGKPRAVAQLVEERLKMKI